MNKKDFENWKRCGFDSFISLPKEPHGYTSQISVEEFSAIEDLAKVYLRLVMIHSKKLKEMEVKEASPYSRIQYIMLSDFIKESGSSIGMLVGINNVSKELLDSMVSENKLDSIDKLELALLLSRIKEMFGED